MYSKITWTDLDRAYLEQLINFAREEDLFSLGQKVPKHTRGDLTSELILLETKASCSLVARKDLTVCGLQLIDIILEVYRGAGNQVDTNQVSCTLFYQDGEQAPKGSVLAKLEGSAQTILTAERVILNFIQKLSGIATLTKSYVQVLKDSPSIKLCDTRKTTPAYRMLEKYAVSCGGAFNHRLGLNHWPMFKDNHLSALGLPNLPELVTIFRQNHPKVPIEIEVDNLEQLPSVLPFNPDIILLDNFSNTDIQIASQKIRIANPKILIEVSGNVSLSSLPELAKLPIDIISTGAITHQSTWVDIGMDWTE